MTRPPQAVRRLVLGRDQWCVRCGTSWALEVHHRRIKGMGGDRREHTDCPCNLLVLCHGDHHGVHHGDRDEAEAFGWIVSRYRELPGEVGVMRFSDGGGITSWPTCEGKWTA